MLSNTRPSLSLDYDFIALNSAMVSQGQNFKFEYLNQGGLNLRVNELSCLQESFRSFLSANPTGIAMFKCSKELTVMCEFILR